MLRAEKGLRECDPERPEQRRLIWAYDEAQSLYALAEAIRHNLSYDGLSPSRDIMVVVLGSGREAARLRTEVAEHLVSRGVRTFTPGALECDVISPKHPHSNANNFWRDGGVTVSQIHRAKGNEAEMVHVVGFDLIARRRERQPAQRPVRGADEVARLGAVKRGRRTPHV